MKSFVLTVTTAAILLAAGTASAEVVKVNVGPTLNPFFLRLTCNEMATKRGGTVVKSERSGTDKTGVCYINIPRSAAISPSGKGSIVATPGGAVRQPIHAIKQDAPSRTHLEMVDAGRLWSQEHATERCRALAIRKNATWTGSWRKHTANSKAQCQLRMTIKPAFVVKAIAAGTIWNDAHAKQQCPRIAANNDGTWTGVWKNDPNNFNKPVCMVRIKSAPEGVVKRFKTTKIWNDAHAKRHCTQLAKENNGQWLGVWRNSRKDENSSVCMIKVPSTHQTTQQTTTVRPLPNVPSMVRNVKAGAIWDQAHATRKCPLVAQNAQGTWTRRWTKTGPGNESVCEVRFTAVNTGTTTSTNTQTANNTRTRNVAAGSIWDDAQAKNKCPVVAANNKAKWTGKWTKTGPGHISVCEVSVVVATNTTQTPTAQPYRSTVREVAAGGIWDQAQASRKCPVIAANNKARWTGKWRKVNSKNDAVCEIDTRI